MDSGNVTLVFLTFVDLFVFVFNAILIARVIMSYVTSPANRIFAALINLTEPVLAPVRRFLPGTQGVDFAPLVTFFLLQGIQFLVHTLLGTPL